MGVGVTSITHAPPAGHAPALARRAVSSGMARCVVTGAARFRPRPAAAPRLLPLGAGHVGRPRRPRPAHSAARPLAPGGVKASPTPGSLPGKAYSPSVVDVRKQERPLEDLCEALPCAARPRVDRCGARARPAIAPPRLSPFCRRLSIRAIPDSGPRAPVLRPRRLPAAQVAPALAQHQPHRLVRHARRVRARHHRLGQQAQRPARPPIRWRARGQHSQ